MNKMTSKQAQALKNRIHWNGFLLTKLERAYLEQRISESSLSSIEASNLIDAFMTVERSMWEEERNNALTIIKQSIDKLYKADPRPACSRCHLPKGAWTEMDEYIICLACNETLTKTN